MAKAPNSFWRFFGWICLVHGCWFAWKAFDFEAELSHAHALVRFSKGELLRSFYFWIFVVASTLSGLLWIRCTLKMQWLSSSCVFGSIGLLLAVIGAYLKVRLDQKGQSLIENMMAKTAYENIQFWLLWIGLYAAVCALSSLIMSK